MTENLLFLGPEKLSVVLKAIVDNRILANLYFLPKVTVTPSDGDFFAYQNERILAAEVTAYDTAARVHSSQSIEVKRSTATRWKHGKAFSESDVKLILDYSKDTNSSYKSSLFDAIRNRHLANLLTGIDIALEEVIVGMFLDSYSYNKSGIRQDNISWGMPGFLKNTPATPWIAANNTSFDAQTDVLSFNDNVRIQTGRRFNRMVMTTSLFRAITKSTLFIAAQKQYMASVLFGASINTYNTTAMMALAKAIFDIEDIVLYDKYIEFDDNTGVITTRQILPNNKIIFMRTEDDNQAAVYALANGPVVESVIGPLAGGGVIGSFPNTMLGPVGYCTAPPDLNPATLTCWATMAAWPQKYDILCSGVMTVATNSAAIAPAVALIPVIPS